MADLTTNLGRDYAGPVTKSRYEVGANLEVFSGQAMIAGTGGIVNLTATANGDFIGFAMENVNNLTNAVPHGGAARAAKADVAIQGFVRLSIAKGSAITYDDVGANVYGSDGNSFDLVQATNEILVGTLVNVDDALGASTGTCLVKFG